MGMTERDLTLIARELKVVLDDVVDGIGDAVKAQLDPIRARLVELEKRPEVRYLGTWQDGLEYSEAALVTRSGSLWFATRSTCGVPGAESSGWKLIVKDGRA